MHGPISFLASSPVTTIPYGWSKVAHHGSWSNNQQLPFYANLFALTRTFPFFHCFSFSSGKKQKGMFVIQSTFITLQLHTLSYEI
ncbi:Uncharacterized protein TCM_030352 [Theobroma cacao]|uniref:Uncharacterized protein n=1 Tax=Theobroma cacao TaxID=3641 RepID=A0A061GP26_THECC|nr:Uncharacterized protein TCM_030352 [Theobroma cacao]